MNLLTLPDLSILTWIDRRVILTIVPNRSPIIQQSHAGWVSTCVPVP